MIEVSYCNDSDNIIFQCSTPEDFWILNSIIQKDIPRKKSEDALKISFESQYRKRIAPYLKPIANKIAVLKSYADWRAQADITNEVVIEVDVVYSKIICDNKEVLPNAQLKNAMGFFLKAAIHSKAYKDKSWNGVISLYMLRGRYPVFPTGLLNLAEQVLNKNNIPYKVKYIYDLSPPRQFNWRAKNLFKLDDDQISAIEAVKVAKRCICKAAVGFGKSDALARYLTADFAVPTLFIASRIQLVDDAAKSFLDGIEGLKSEDVGKIAEGEFLGYNDLDSPDLEIKSKIIVSTIQSMNARLNDPKTKHKLECWLKETCKLLIVDECHLTGTKMFDDVLTKIYSPYRLFLSATPKRKDGSTIKIQAYSGPVAFSTSGDEQIEKGRLCELDIEYIDFDHEVYNNRDSSNSVYFEWYDAAIVNNSKRNRECVLEPAIKMYNEGRFILVLVQRIEHGSVLYQMFIDEGFSPEEVRFAWGKTKKKVRAETVDDFRNGKFHILIGSTIFDMGVNIPIISGVCIAGAGDSDITLIQRIGRGARTFDYQKKLGYTPKFIEESGGIKITKVVDVYDKNIVFFEEQAKDRIGHAKREFGKHRVTASKPNSFKKNSGSGSVDLNEILKAQLEVVKTFTKKGD